MFLSKDKLNHWVAATSHLWLFLDYDGTLVDFAPVPGTSKMEPEVVELIQELAEMSRFRVAIISGRPLRSIRELLPVKKVFMSGIYGLELQTAEGEVIERDGLRLIRLTLDRIKPGWESLIAGKKDFYLEDKGWTLALHAPGARLEEAGSIFNQARKSAAQKLPENTFRWFESSFLLEIVPVQASKGEALRYLYEYYPFQDAQLLYMGDDAKDQEAFEMVHSLGGLNVQVVHPENPFLFPGTDHLMNSPQEVRNWLKGLLR